MNENCYPYKARVEKCQITQGSRKLSANGCYLTDESGRDEFYTVGPAYSLRNETDIMAEIFHSGPVQATMKVERDFFAYSSGVYRYTAANRNSPAGLHSVKLIGWGEEHDGTKYWVNSVHINVIIFSIYCAYNMTFVSCVIDCCQFLGYLVGREGIFSYITRSK